MGFVSGLAAFVNKIVNKLFGKTAIFIILLAWFLIITGIIMLFKPQRAKKMLASQGFGIVKFYLFMLAMFLGGLLVSAAGKINGMLALALLIAGLVALIRVYMRVKKHVAKKIAAFAEKITVRYLIVYAVVQIAVGILMLKFHRRIWF